MKNKSSKKMIKFTSDELYCAVILLELPRLVLLSELKQAWNTRGVVWKTTKKRSARRSVDDVNCKKGRSITSSSSMAHFVSEGSSSWRRRSASDVVVWKLTMDKSWIELERGDSRYIQGLIDFVEFAKQTGEKTHLCPCRKCLLVRGRISTNEMVVHLINNGMMNSYTTWTSHGERSIEPSAYQLRQEWLKERYGETSSSATHQQANRTLEILHDQFPFRHIHEEDHMNMNAENGDSDSILAYDRYTNLVGEAQTPLYKGCDHIVLETILRAMQMKVESRLSDKGFDKMLHNTKKILPPDNNYPGSYKDVKKVLRNMGMGYEMIHACEHGCVLYYKEFKDQLSCPVCGEARYTLF
ncbi:hypothetical protein QQ045_001032 [Rhodiola kirilowii]